MKTIKEINALIGSWVWRLFCCDNGDACFDDDIMDESYSTRC